MFEWLTFRDNTVFLKGISYVCMAGIRYDFKVKWGIYLTWRNGKINLMEAHFFEMDNSYFDFDTFYTHLLKGFLHQLRPKIALRDKSVLGNVFTICYEDKRWESHHMEIKLSKKPLF